MTRWKGLHSLSWRVAKLLRVATVLVALPVSAFAAPDEYRISIGDVVSFDFLDDTLAAEQLTVASSGQITLPLIGGLNVAGLSVPEATQAIRRNFVDRRFFIDPQFSLAIVSFRPIFVLGDVKAPGSFPFQPTMTVEQAVALAGGQASGGATAEDRVVTRARLRGDLDESAVRITGEAAAVARLNVQLAGGAKVGEQDLPEKVRGFVSTGVIASLLPTEQRILESEQRSFATRRDQLTAAITEVNGALVNLNELAERQKQTIASSQVDLERARALYKRGIKTLTDISSFERDANTQESHLLEIYNQMSNTRRELGALQREMAETVDLSRRTALDELQKHTAEIERLLAVRQSKEEQVLLLGTLVAEQAQKASSVVFSYLVRRTMDGKVVTREAGLDDQISPGDTVLVSIDRSSTAGLTKMASTTDEPLR